MKDLPDWTRQVTIRYEGGFIGLEELATRLGFIGPYDLKGNIVLMEDFESEETEWASDCDGLGSTATRTSRHKFSGDWAVKLYNVASIGAYSILSRPLHFPGLSKYALFGRFSGDANMENVYLGVDLRSDTEEYYAEVAYSRYQEAIGALKVITTGGSYHEVATPSIFPTEPFVWLPVLVTFDLAAGYYDKLYFADQEFDISDVALSLVGTGGGNYSTLYLGSFIDHTATENNTYFDDIILVKNVP